jgi:hypothetical protein
MLILYSPAVVCIIWALVWTLGVHGQAAVVIGLICLGVAYAAAEVERERHGRA